MKIAIIGAGNGGQAIAGYLGMQGYDIALCDKHQSTIDTLSNLGGIKLEGVLNGFGKVNSFSTNIEESISGAEIIMVTTTANAHGVLACEMSEYLQEGQIVILNPGRTGGALEFHHSLKKKIFTKKIFIAEAQTLVYACRIITPGVVNIIGVKDKVLLSALPSSDTDSVLQKLNILYPCFVAAKNILVTSFDNIGSVFHPSVVLFNAASIERGELFYFYRDMTTHIAKFIEKIDEERINVCKAYGIEIMSAKDWISYTYEGTQGDTLCEKMKNCPAYHNILAPTQINCRQISEDIPTGFVPLLEFGRIAGVKMPLFESVLTICSQLLDVDFYANGRTLDKLGLADCKSIDDIYKIIK